MSAPTVRTARPYTKILPTQPANNGRSPFDQTRHRAFRLFVYPAVIVYTLVMVLPTLFTLWVSLNKWAGAGPMEWAGLRNYTGMIKDPVFKTAFVNTLWIVFGVGAAVFLIAFALTMLMHDMLGRRWARAIVFFPSLIPGIAISVLWGYLFNPDGLVNTLLGKVGVHNPPAWLSQDHMFMTVLMGLTWLSTGTYVVIFMAAVDRIPPDFYDAAKIAGASAMQQFRYITFPMMRDVVATCSVLWIVGALKTFEFLLTFSAVSGKLPPTQIWNFSMYSYASAFPADGASNFGVASASGVVVLVLTGTVTFLSLKVLNRDSITY